MRRFLPVVILAIILLGPLLANSQQAGQPQNRPPSGTSTHSIDRPKPSCTDNGTYVNSKGPSIDLRIVPRHHKGQPHNAAMEPIALAEVDEARAPIKEV